jgi:hypothetical protein
MEVSVKVGDFGIADVGAVDEAEEVKKRYRWDNMPIDLTAKTSFFGDTDGRLRSGSEDARVRLEVIGSDVVLSAHGR